MPACANVGLGLRLSVQTQLCIVGLSLRSRLTYWNGRALNGEVDVCADVDCRSPPEARLNPAAECAPQTMCTSPLQISSNIGPSGSEKKKSELERALGVHVCDIQLQVGTLHSRNGHKKHMALVGDGVGGVHM